MGVVETGRDGIPKVLDLMYLAALPGGLRMRRDVEEEEEEERVLMAAPYILLKLVYNIVWI